MGKIQEILDQYDGYFFCIQKNPENLNYEVLAVIPAKWEYNSNKLINIEKINENDDGVLIKIYSMKNSSMDLDNLLDYLQRIIDTNNKIEEMEEELNKKISEYRNQMNRDIEERYNEIDKLKKEQFNLVDEKNSVTSKRSKKSANKEE